MERIKYLIMDVDGTLTDGNVYIGDSGEIMKAFNVKDGYGIRNILPSNGIEPVVITGRHSRILENRCAELGINVVYQDVVNKVECLKRITQNYAEVAYIGDDLNDLQCMILLKRNGGIVGCPKDASPTIVDNADFVSSKDGGCGAVREFIDWLTN